MSDLTEGQRWLRAASIPLIILGLGNFIRHLVRGPRTELDWFNVQFNAVFFAVGIILAFLYFRSRRANS